MVDAHGSLEVPVAIKLAKALEPYDIAWFEEPVSQENHRGQAEVRRIMRSISAELQAAASTAPSTLPSRTWPALAALRKFVVLPH